MIAASTLVLQPNPPSWILRKVLGASSRVVPWANFPVDIKPGVSLSTIPYLSAGVIDNFVQDLSRNAASNEAYMTDPYVKGTGTVRALHELLDGVCIKFPFSRYQGIAH